MKIEGKLRESVGRALRATLGDLEGELRQVQAQGARVVSQRAGVAAAAKKLAEAQGDEVELSEGELAALMFGVGRRPWVEVAGVMEGLGDGMKAVGMKAVGMKAVGVQGYRG